MENWMENWREALKWGIGLAILQRIILLIWFAIIFFLLKDTILFSTNRQVEPEAELPKIESPAAQAMFLGWRRWDSIHYFNIAEHGYQNGNLKTTVFPPLTSMSMKAFNIVLPGPIDFAAMVFETVVFSVFLTLFYRFCEIYYPDPKFLPSVLIITTFLPMSYLFSAPLSESLYMAIVMAAFLLALNDHWVWATLACILAGLARNQGAALGAVLGLLLVETHGLQNWKLILRKGWWLIFSPLGYIIFVLYRNSLDLPSINDVMYNTYDQIHFVNPIEGLYINLSWFVKAPLNSLTGADTPDRILLLIILGLSVLALRYPQHRRLPLLAYTWGFIAIFVSKVGAFETLDGKPFEYTQSTARYSLTLFPLVVLVTDLFLASSRRVKIGLATFSIIGFLMFSMMHLLGIGLFI